MFAKLFMELQVPGCSEPSTVFLNLQSPSEEFLSLGYLP
jgi:hypothetical protein